MVCVILVSKPFLIPAIGAPMMPSSGPYGNGLTLNASLTMSTNLGDMRRRARPIKAYHSDAPAATALPIMGIWLINSVWGERRGTLGIL